MTSISKLVRTLENILALKKLALISGLNGIIKFSSSEFADYISSSPQTASRRLQSLEQAGYITRRIDPSGQQIRITKEGRQVLETEYLEYRKIFTSPSTPIELTGRIITGLGEGQYYITVKGYRDQFIKLLGFDPYPGTLNIKLETESIKCRPLLNLKDEIIIKGFSTRNRTFGGGRCYPVTLGNNITGAIMIPDRTHYPDDIIEIISPENLREHLDLKDDSTITVVVQ
jgi:riboflavin kinase